VLERQEKPKVTKLDDIFAFLKIVGSLEAIVLGTHAGANIIEFKSVFLAPPLGSEGSFVLPLLYVGAALCTILLWFVKWSKVARMIALTFLGVFLVAVVAYYHVAHMYVRYVPSTATGRIYMVSVGTERTQYARDKYGDAGDVQMLHKEGWNDEETSLLWTSPSIECSRRKLWMAYFLLLAPAQLVVGGIARVAYLEKHALG
jgi:hypothetical protein